MLTFQRLTPTARACALLGLAVFVLSLALPAQAQNSRMDGIVWSRNGFPSPGASIAVCSNPVSSQAAAPYCSNLAALCSSLTDAVCTSPNPVTADSMGNFHFYVKPGMYTKISYNSGLSPFTEPDQLLACSTAANCTVAAIILADGTVSAPAQTWTNAPTSGPYRAGSGDFRYSIGGVDAFRMTATQLVVPATTGWCFGSSGVTSPDTGFTRLAAGSAALGNCTASDGSGSLTLTTITSNGNSGTTLAFSARDFTLTTAVGSSSVGGSETHTLGAGNGAFAGGAFAYTAGNGGATGAGGGYAWTAGNGGATSGAAGSFVWTCGTVVSGTGCSLQFNAKASIYNSITLVRNGISSEVAAVDATAQTAAITTTTLYAVPSTGAGQYRLSWNAKITTAAGTSSTLGALTIVYTDPDGVTVTLTSAAVISAGTVATTSAANTTGTVLIGIPQLINAKASTNITYAFAYASNAANAMNYNLHITLEAQ